MSRRPAADSNGPDWEQAKLAIQEFGGSIRNADSKITILAAALGVSLTFALPRVASSVQRSSESANSCEWWALLLLAIAGSVCASLTGYNLYRALAPRVMPRIAARGDLNRFSWPSMAAEANAPVPDKVGGLEEAWEQAHTLATIAKAKYDRFTVALRFLVAYLVVFGFEGFLSQFIFVY